MPSTLRVLLRPLCAYSQSPRHLQNYCVKLPCGQPVGKVQKVLRLDEPNKNPLLSVQRVWTEAPGPLQSVLEPTAEAPHAIPYMGALHMEEHLIPFVPDVVVKIDRKAHVLTINPPHGLLEIGRQRRLMRLLEPELAGHGRLGKDVAGTRFMPTQAELQRAGRKDLVKRIHDAGGFCLVAQHLGRRLHRSPPGFWDNLDNIDNELTWFILHSWKLQRMQAHGPSLWYNPVLGIVQVEKPTFPESIHVASQPEPVLMDAPAHRVMPTRKQLEAGGRYDLTAAIARQGGYLSVAERLDRHRLWPRPENVMLDDMEHLQRQLMHFMQDHHLPEGTLPTAQALLEHGRNDIHYAIMRSGGFQLVAKNLGWTTASKPMHRQGLAAVAAKIHEHMQQHDLADLPTFKELREADLKDLARAMQVHSSAAVAGQLGLTARRRGRPKSEDLHT
ncbi:hypothetical protein WJX74_002592 [Apatococcus lobatus]|uniref:Uncharacterized protein n=1 Tax=Apatococcus lobatus TaxID=904363 RepID=A0AAW1PRH4_9CHLO